MNPVTVAEVRQNTVYTLVCKSDVSHTLMVSSDQVSTKSEVAEIANDKGWRVDDEDEDEDPSLYCPLCAVKDFLVSETNDKVVNKILSHLEYSRNAAPDSVLSWLMDAFAVENVKKVPIRKVSVRK